MSFDKKEFTRLNKEEIKSIDDVPNKSVSVQSLSDNYQKIIKLLKSAKPASSWTFFKEKMESYNLSLFTPDFIMDNLIPIVELRVKFPAAGWYFNNIFLENNIDHRTLQLIISLTKILNNDEFNNKLFDFEDEELYDKEQKSPFIGKILQQGGKFLFENTYNLLSVMPSEITNFTEQYKWLEKHTKPNYLTTDWQKTDTPLKPKKIVFYYRFFRGNFGNYRTSVWQGADMIQSSLIIHDLVRMLQQGNLQHLKKIIITPRESDDFPYFLEDILIEEFGKKFVGNHFEFSNQFHSLVKDPNAHFIELCDGTIQNKLGIIGSVNIRKRNKNKINENIVVPIFWPDTKAYTEWIELSKNGKTNMNGIEQPKTIDQVRATMVKAVLDLDKKLSS